MSKKKQPIKNVSELSIVLYIRDHVGVGLLNSADEN